MSAAAPTADELNLRLQAILRARDSGVLLVRHGDTSTQFRSLAEMESIISSLEDQIAVLSGTKKRASVNYITQRTKGYGHARRRRPFDC